MKAATLKGLLILTLGLSLSVSSCVDDDLMTSGSKGGPMCLRAEVNDEWRDAANTRANENVPERSQKSLRTIRRGYELQSDGGDESIYIFEGLSDIFRSPSNVKASVPEVRGHVVKSSNFTDTHIGVYTFFQGTDNERFYMRNIEFSYSGNNGVWTPKSENYLWPESKMREHPLQIFAYHPYFLESGSTPLDVYKEGDKITLHYKVPDKLNDQKDLLISDIKSYNSVASIPANGPQLSFNHALTSVRFTCSDKSMYTGKVTNITIRNIKGEGDFDMETGTWNTENYAKKDFSFDINTKIIEIAGENKDDFIHYKGDILGSADFTLMMMPQDLSRLAGRPDAPQIEITFTDSASNTKRVFKSELDVRWEPGKAICYNISKTPLFTEYTFKVNCKGGKIVESTGNAEVRMMDDDNDRNIYFCGNHLRKNENKPEIHITSYFTIYQYAGNKNVIVTQGVSPAKWHGYRNQYFSDNNLNAFNSNDITWITASDDENTKNFNMIGGGVLGQDSIEKTVWIELDSISNPSISNSGTRDILNHNPKKDYDLSMEKGTMNTANSYIINSCGSYKIPLVYGNAIKNGHVNEDAYICKKQGSNILTHFLRPDNRPITDPWIKNNTTTVNGKTVHLIPDHAKIERYQSLNGASHDNKLSGETNFSRLAIDDEKKYLIVDFTSQTSTYPCNALISVRDKDENVLWAWHIWVTPQDPANQTFQLGDDEVSCMTMGQIGGNLMSFESRNGYVTLQQKNNKGEVTGSVKIEYQQEGYTAFDFPESLYYQHGRPIPVSCYVLRRDINENGNPRVHGIHKEFLSASYHHDSSIAPGILTGRELNTTPASIGKVLSTPRMLFASNGRKKVYDTPYTNLWNNGTPENPVKTVYDPCPPGWMVLPTGSHWTTKFTKGNVEFINNPNPSSDEPWRNNYGFRFIDGFLTRGTVMTYDNANQTEHRTLYSSYWTSEGHTTSTIGDGGVVQFKFLNTNKDGNKATAEELWREPVFDFKPASNSDGMDGGAGIRFFSPAYLLMILPVRER